MTARLSTLLAALLALLPAAALAGPPRVVADVLPVQSLVARVMEGVGSPSLLMPPGASPHSYAMRPSEARALQEADLVVWIGESLTPWLGRALPNLAGDATALKLTQARGTTLLGFREAAGFGPEPHEEEAGAGHEEGTDPHAWLDPQNARLWLGLIANKLSEIDPDNAARYRANAVRGMTEIDALIDEIAAALAPVRGRRFIVFHDAYRYFETRFGIEAAGAVALGDASEPGAARVREVRSKVAEWGDVCVFSEPQFTPRLIRTITEGTAARYAALDPLGTGLEPGPGLYEALMRKLAGDLVGCLSAPED